MSAITNTNRSNGLLYLLVGSGIGAAVALLFAPKSGTELRSDISDMTHRGYDQATELASRVKDQSVDLLQTAKTKANDLLDLTRSQFSSVTEKAENALGGISPELAEGVDRLQEKFGSHQQNTPRSGRRSSNIV